MSEVSEGQLKLLYARIFDLYCEDNGVSHDQRDKVEATKFIPWLLNEQHDLPLVDRLKAMSGLELDESVYDVTMAAISSPDAALYFYHLFPFLSLGHRICKPHVASVEIGVTIRYSDGAVVKHPTIGITDSANDGSIHDGAVCMAFNKVASALIKWIRTNSLQQLHDRAAGTASPKPLTANAGDQTFRDQLIRLAQQPLHGGFP